jgi:prolyl oligopeptidase
MAIRCSALVQTGDLRVLSYETCFHEPTAGGHGYGKDNKERDSFTDLGYAFLREKVGWPPEAV